MSSLPSTSSSSLESLSSSSLRRLMSLDSPRVALGKRCDLVKEEIIQRPSSSSPAELPFVKRESQDSSSRRFCCSLCTSRPGDDKLSSYCPPDPRRTQHLASLLGRSEEEVDIIFCSICRKTVTKLFRLKEEVDEIESRIRAVVKLHPPAKPLGDLGTVKVESLDCCPLIEEGESNDGDFTSVVHDTTTPLVPEETGSKDGQDDDEAISEPCDRAEGPGQKSSCPQGRARRNNNLHKKRTVDLATFPPPSRRKVKVCLICKKRFQSSELFKAHNHPDKNDPSVVSYSCHLCHKSYSSTANLIWHRGQVHLHRPSHGNCRRCGKQFQTRRNLQRHIGTTCPLLPKDERKCCGQVFANGAERLEHETLAHKPKCYFCSKVLLKSSTLVHLRTHTGERPYLCDKCGKDFVETSSLRYHMAVVCGTDEKRREEVQRRYRDNTRRRRAKFLYPCDLCDKRLGTKQGLIRHQKRCNY